MIRVRFHGRGGHGVKTASRILGTAAFLAGREVQDSPVYGAERRGAAVVAFTRIADEAILERGVIARPSLIVVADETLLADPGAGVLAGEDPDAIVFVNAESSQALMTQHGISARLVSLDVTAVTLELLGHASALSAGLGAAAARLIGLVSEQQLLDAVREELEHTGIDNVLIEKNLKVAERVFRAVPQVELRSVVALAGGEIQDVGHDDVLRGTPSIFAAGNSEQRHTGSWRVERPEIDYDRCTRCGICFVRCPDGAISLDSDGYPRIDYDHCKGCMICWDQCPVEGGIQKRKEVRAW